MYDGSSIPPTFLKHVSDGSMKNDTFKWIPFSSMIINSRCNIRCVHMCFLSYYQIPPSPIQSNMSKNCICNFHQSNCNNEIPGVYFQKKNNKGILSSPQIKDCDCVNMINILFPCIYYLLQSVCTMNNSMLII